MGIPVTEQETTISFNRDSDTAFIWTSDSTVMTKLDKLVESSPECWQLIRTDTVGKDLVGKEYTAKKRLISFRSKFTNFMRKQRPFRVGVIDFGRYPFCILSTFRDKLRYAMAALVGNNVYSDQLAKGIANLKELKRICKENIPSFEDFDFDTLEYSRGEKLDYGYAQDYGGLEVFLEKNNVSIEDFLVKKRYIVIVDGDEYNAWDKLKSSGIVNTSVIEKEVVMG